MIETKNLLTVKALNGKLAKQIEILCYDWKEGSRYREIWEALHKVNDGGMSPMGWVNGEPIGTSRPVDFWLVRHQGQLVWWAAPSKDCELGKLHWPGLEQLFIS